MPKKVGSLDVELTANTAKLKRDMSSGERIIRASASRMSSAAKTASRALSAIGTAAAAGAVGLSIMVRRTSENIDATAKFADVIGLTTEQLTGYQLASKITGATLGQLNTGLTRLQKNIADAEAGLATAVREFDRLGIAVEDLRGLSTDEQIKLIADRFKQLPTTIDRSSVALNLFGRSGIQLGKLLNEGSEGINRFQREADELGLAFNRIDAAKVEEANDSLTRAKAISDGFSQSLTIELAPVIKSITDTFIEAGKEAGGFGNLARDGIDKVALGVGVLLDGLHGIDIIYTALKASAHEWVDFTLGNILALDAAVLEFAENTLGKLGIELEGLTDSRRFLEGLSEQIGLNKEAIENELQAKLLEELPSTGIEKALQRARAEAQKAAEEIVRTQEAARDAASGNVIFTEFAKPSAKRKKLPQDVNDRLREGKDLFDSTRTPLEEFNIKLDRYRELLDHGAVSQDTFNRGVKQAQKEFEDSTKGMSVYADQAARNIQDAFADFLFNPFKEGLDGMLRGFVQILGRMAAEAAAAQIFSSKSDGGFGLGDLFTEGVKSLLSFDGGGFTGPGSRVGGLDGRGGFMALVHPNETVVDHSRGQGVGGVVQNITVRAPNPPAFVKAASRAALEGRRRLQGYG